MEPKIPIFFRGSPAAALRSFRKEFDLSSQAQRLENIYLRLMDRND